MKVFQGMFHAELIQFRITSNFNIRSIVKKKKIVILIYLARYTRVIKY